MNMKEYSLHLLSNSEEDTSDLANLLSKHLPFGSLISLDGELAAGKTVFSRALFASLGYVEGFCSPTFAIMNEYENGKNYAYHLDVYRIEDIEELDYIGFYEAISEGELIVIEWANMIKEVLSDDTIYIVMTKLDDENKRQLTISSKNEKFILEIADALIQYAL